MQGMLKYDTFPSFWKFPYDFYDGLCTALVLGGRVCVSAACVLCVFMCMLAQVLECVYMHAHAVFAWVGNPRI